MGDRSTLPSKPEEQYPLLKVEGGGDGSHSQPVSTVITPNWGGICTNKHNRFSRWPEFISACWITVILFGISFLVFYALGMGVYRRHPFLFTKYVNTSNRVNNVYYHNIVPRGNSVPFVLFSAYLENMATKYPLLDFNIYFLIDDSYPINFRSRRGLNYYSYPTNNYKIDEINRDAVADFQRRYPNVNITIMTLSKYMAMTPFKYKWRTIPLSYLTFYARVYSVWLNGGIGIDLRTFNNDFHTQHATDLRLDTILRQHSYGINTEEHANALNRISKDEEHAVFDLFNGLISNLLNQTRSWFNMTLSYPLLTQKERFAPLTRTNSNKREAINKTVNVSSVTSEDFEAANKIVLQSTNDSKTANNAITVTNITNEKPKTQFNGLQNINNSDVHQVVLFYDLSIFSDNIGPSYSLLESLDQPNFGTYIKSPELPSRTLKCTKGQILTIDAEGMFIAAAPGFHPFLGQLISAGCQKLAPKYAIRDALFTQCAGVYRDDIYCNNIFIL